MPSACDLQDGLQTLSVTWMVQMGHNQISEFGPVRLSDQILMYIKIILHSSGKSETLVEVTWV